MQAVTKQQWTLKSRPEGIPDRSEIDVETETDESYEIDTRANWQ